MKPLERSLNPTDKLVYYGVRTSQISILIEKSRTINKIRVNSCVQFHSRTFHFEVNVQTTIFFIHLGQKVMG